MLLGKDLNIRLFQPNSFLPAILTGTNHFIPLSVALAVAEGHKVSRKQIFFILYLRHFSSDQDEVRCGVAAV